MSLNVSHVIVLYTWISAMENIFPEMTWKREGTLYKSESENHGLKGFGFMGKSFDQPW